MWLGSTCCLTLEDLVNRFARTHRAAAPLLAALAASVTGLGACDAQYADAVVPEPDGSTGSVRVFPDLPGAGGANNEVPDPDDGLPDNGDTLCLPCSSSLNCGGRDNLCLFIGGEPRCGRECSGEHDCPSDFDCIPVSPDPDDEWQCVPEQGSCRDSPASLDEMRGYVRAVLNDVRARRGLDPLRESECLDMIGQEAVAELDSEGTLYTKFNRECANFVPQCECDWSEESQAFVNVESRTWEEAVEYPFERAAQLDPDGSFFQNVVSDDWERLGVGVLLDYDYLRISLEFAP